MGVALEPFLSSDIFMGNFERWVGCIGFEEADTILDKLISIYAGQIKFTSEKEVEGKTAFLDV